MAAFPLPSTSTDASRISFVTVKCSVEYPALTQGLFDLLRTEAAVCGFPDVGDTNVDLTLEFSGPGLSLKHAEQLKSRLHDLWLGATVELKMREGQVTR